MNNELGRDTISTGTPITATMELVETGEISESRLRGLNPTFGNGDTETVANGDDQVFSAIVLMVAAPVLATPMLLKLAIEFK
uniref:Aldehyde ferredoxin oxidoreductase C-terminal domain-containing protein n=2 Tax=Methanosarcinales TaxID=94695 RepID=A0A7G9Y4L4_9EURY|nr:hypothetical protein IHLAGKGC_00004 [Methanosarcinales archaeon ANME-2c ERB4]QNT35678.1 hypothetical protein HAHEADPM_00012 [uncultured Methanosarcinales archaeon]